MEKWHRITMERGHYRRMFAKVKAKSPIIGLVLCLGIALSLYWWQYRRTDEARETVSIGLTNDELISIRKLIGSTSAGNPQGGTRLSISQVRDLEERLTTLEKAIPIGDSLSAAASNDLRLLQRDIEVLKERQVFQGQLIKEQRTELSDQIKVSMGFMGSLILAILAFFWQVSEKKTL